MRVRPILIVVPSLGVKYQHVSRHALCQCPPVHEIDATRRHPAHPVVNRRPTAVVQDLHSDFGTVFDHRFAPVHGGHLRNGFAGVLRVARK